MTDLFFTKQNKTKQNKKKLFQELFTVFSSKNVLNNHTEDYLSINSAQSIRLEKGTIKFKNYFKQLPVPFKVYADLSVI